MCFYLKPAHGNLSLDSLERVSSSRLKCLQHIYSTHGCFKRLRRFTLKVDLLTDMESIIENSWKDTVSHYMLRFLCCQRRDLQDFFLSAEEYLFRYRWHNMSRDLHAKELRKLSRLLKSRQVRDSQDSDVTEALDTLTWLTADMTFDQLLDVYHSASADDVTVEIPFQHVLSLVGERLVSVHRGLAQVPVSRLDHLLLGVHLLLMRSGLERCARRLPAVTSDRRVRRVLLRLVAQQDARRHVTPRGHVGLQRAEDVADWLALFPPCMAQLHRTLRTKNRLPHHARIRYTLFLKDLGLPANENVRFWRAAYLRPRAPDAACEHLWSTRYERGVLHLYGRAGGGGKDYRAHSCATLQRTAAAAREQVVCPLTLTDPGKLCEALRVAPPDVEDLMTLGDASAACRRLLDLRLDARLQAQCSQGHNPRSSQGSFQSQGRRSQGQSRQRRHSGAVGTPTDATSQPGEQSQLSQYSDRIRSPGDFVRRFKRLLKPDQLRVY